MSTYGRGETSEVLKGTTHSRLPVRPLISAGRVFLSPPPCVVRVGCLGGGVIIFLLYGRYQRERKGGYL